ncbi:MAG: response regulator transcription factor [Lachnospiraceae bacterium]|nr:response regulator transcription factor [Lachnospiraceae bacterium]
MRILVVEDERQLRQGLKELLEGCGYAVDTAESCKDAFRFLENVGQKERNQYDAFFLDVLLPDGDGFSICERIRKISAAPILFLTAMDQEDYVIKGLEMGADDYIMKPFRSRELISRLQANLRRIHQEQPGTLLCSGDLTLDIKKEHVLKAGKPLKLRRIEYELLKMFMQNEGILLRRERLLERMWDSAGEFVEDNTLSVQVSRLRERIGSWQGESYIETARGLGYRWRVNVEKQ